MTKRRMHDGSMWENQKFCSLSPMQQLLFCALIDTVDDQGRMLADPTFVRSRCFPFLDIKPEDMRTDLQSLGANESMILYQSAGINILQITNWWKYQCPQWASPSKLSPPDGWRDRIRHKVGGAVYTYNWTTTDNRAIPDTCDSSGRPIAIPSGEPSPIASPEATPCPTDHDYGYGDDEGNGHGDGEGKPRASAPPTPPPIGIFRELTKCCPAPGTPMWDAIAALPNHNGDMETWRKVIQEWMMRGFKTRNIAGMLDWFHNGIPPRGPAVTKSGNPRKGTGVNIATDPDIRTAIRHTEERWEAEHGA